jgi:hypothetical protein
LANDHFAYIGVYRDAIDSLQMTTHELWKIVMDEKSSQSDKTAAIKEIHNIEKTKVLLLRDLPFITRLSKFYDLSLFNNSLSNKSNSYSIDSKPKPFPNLLEKDHNERYKDLKNQFKDESIEDAIATITANKLQTNHTNSNVYKNVDDPIIEEMQRQSKTD